MKIQLATVISRVLDPFLLLVFLLVLGVHQSTLTTSEQLRFTVISSVTMIGIPVLLLFLAIRKGIVSNWDISIRKERPKVLITLLSIEIVNLILMQRFMDVFLLNVIIFIFAVLAGFTAVTFFWKISGHACMNALVSGLVVVWFGPSWWPVLLVVPLVGWARVVRKDHTVAQVVAGSFYAWIFVFIYNAMV